MVSPRTDDGFGSINLVKKSARKPKKPNKLKKGKTTAATSDSSSKNNEMPENLVDQEKKAAESKAKADDAEIESTVEQVTKQGTGKRKRKSKNKNSASGTEPTASNENDKRDNELHRGRQATKGQKKKNNTDAQSDTPSSGKKDSESGTKNQIGKKRKRDKSSENIQVNVVNKPKTISEKNDGDEPDVPAVSKRSKRFKKRNISIQPNSKSDTKAKKQKQASDKKAVAPNEKQKEQNDDDSTTSNDNDGTDKESKEKEEEGGIDVKEGGEIDFEKKDERLRRTLFVGNINQKATSKDLMKLFSSHGSVESIRIRGVVPVNPKIPKRVAFLTRRLNEFVDAFTAYVVFKDAPDIEESVTKIKQKLHLTVFMDKHIRVMPADSSQSRMGNRFSAFVGNIPYNCTEEEFIQAFVDVVKELGTDLHNVQLNRDRDTGICRGSGFVTFTHDTAIQALMNMSGSISIRKNQLRFTKARKEKNVLSHTFKRLKQEKKGKGKYGNLKVGKGKIAKKGRS